MGCASVCCARQAADGGQEGTSGTFTTPSSSVDTIQVILLGGSGGSNGTNAGGSGAFFEVGYVAEPARSRGLLSPARIRRHRPSSSRSTSACAANSAASPLGPTGATKAVVVRVRPWCWLSYRLILAASTGGSATGIAALDETLPSWPAAAVRARVCGLHLTATGGAAKDTARNAVGGSSAAPGQCGGDG